MATKKVLVLYAPCGAGHQKAAQAIAEYFKEQNVPEVITKDILSFAPYWYRTIYRDGYYFLIRKFPLLWALLYHSTEMTGPEGSLRRALRKWEQKLFPRFFVYLREAAPDLVITTHFLPISLLKEVKTTHKFAVVITDYCAHSLWISVFVDRYFVACEEVKQILVGKGIVPERISVTGIPIMPVPSPRAGKQETRKVLGLDPNVFTVLLLSGSGGSGDIYSIIKGLEKYAGTLQLMVSTGMNKKLEKDLQQKFAATPLVLKIFGFADSIYQYYQAADIVISKPGGLTVTECLAFGLPLFMVNAIPGQEEENAKFLVGNKAGVLVQDLSKLPDLVEELLQDPANLAELSSNALKIAPQDAAQKIYEEVK